MTKSQQVPQPTPELLEKIRIEEREACAKIAEEFLRVLDRGVDRAIVEGIVQAIRQR